MRGTWPAEQPTLTDGVVPLRPWRAEDAEAVFRACQDPDLQHFTQVPVPFPVIGKWRARLRRTACLHRQINRDEGSAPR